MDMSVQATKAADFLSLHHDPKLLVLPNIWDPLGARMLEEVQAVPLVSRCVERSGGILSIASRIQLVLLDTLR